MRFGFALLFILPITAVTMAADPDSPRNIAESPATRPAAADLPVVAIKEFKNEAKAPDGLFRSLRARITGDILNTRKFTLVERERLDTAMSEQKLLEAGVTNPQQALDRAAIGAKPAVTPALAQLK